MIEKGSASKRKSSLEDISNTDEDELLSEKINSVSSAAGKRKHESTKSKASASGGANNSSVKGKKPAKVNSNTETQNPGLSTSAKVDNHDAIMSMLVSIQEGQKRQSDDIRKPHDDGENVDNESEPPGKKQNKDDNRFSSMSKRCKVQELCDVKIDEVLANNVNELFRNGMNEEQYSDLTKDENNARPENCEGLSIVRINQLMWNVISPGAQSADKKLQFLERTIVKAATILTKTVNKMAIDENNNANGNSGSGEYIDKCNDVLALLGHANRQLNMTRRDFLKPEMMAEYVPLCSHSVPYTNNLFGDDVSKVAKDIEDCSKVGNKLKFGSGRAEVATVEEEVASEEEEVEVPALFKKLPERRKSTEVLDTSNEVSHCFKAGVLKKFSDEWEKITSDKFILDIVSHCHIEFIDNVEPKQDILIKYDYNPYGRQKQNLVKECKWLLQRNLAKIRDVAKVIGLIVSLFLPLNSVNCFIVTLKRKNYSFKNSKGDFEQSMLISNQMKGDLEWWVANVSTELRHISHGSPQIVIQTDASLLGWGGILSDNEIGGRWTDEESKIT
ncbi:unnamed protein product [Mytilus edulis]|uniref:Uncharacterized protein n=1 Tax=Mytilus edulis TaxID=6550 RepID=A0A8S3QNP1_MYTED|nr:unnamed protein product [Mytilus edulis]